MTRIFAKAPKDASTNELERFIDFVNASGEVASGGLNRRVRGAESLAFLQVADQFVGIAGLKNPEAAYRASVAQKSGFELQENVFPFELGWVFIECAMRGKGLSFPLCELALKAAGTRGVFATSRTSKEGMHAVLAKLGFTRVGRQYESKQNDGDLCLFVRYAG